jgi:hypothetical protein
MITVASQSRTLWYGEQQNSIAGLLDFHFIFILYWYLAASIGISRIYWYLAASIGSAASIGTEV